MTFDDAQARDMAEYTESPAEREERESILAGAGIVPDSVWVEWQDTVAEDLASYHDPDREHPRFMSAKY